jgi:hypothetical protein
MASTRTIRKRAQEKMRDGNASRWALAAFGKAYTQMQRERLQACSLPASVVAAIRSVDACELSDAAADRLIAQIHQGEAIATKACLYEEEFESSLQRLAKTARMVPRDDGTTGFAFG